LRAVLLAASWDAVRASGFTAYALLALAVVLGLLLSLRWQSRRWPRLVTNELHNFVALLAMAFGVVHGVAAWLDPFMRFGPAEVLVPLASHYRPLWLAFGIVAFYLMAAILISTWLRPRLGYRLWRALHLATFLAFAFATVHGIGTGSDTATWWGAGIYAVAALIVVGLTLRRLMAPAGRLARPRPTAAGLVVAAAAVLAYWTASGPLRPGWNEIANDGQGSGARIALAASVVADPAPMPSRFAARLVGSLSFVPQSDGTVLARIAGRLRGGVRGDVMVLIAGVPTTAGLEIVRSQVTLYRADGTAAYQGQITGVGAGEFRARVASVAGGASALDLTIVWSESGRTVTGSVEAVPATVAAVRTVGPGIGFGHDDGAGADIGGTEESAG
jgi:hypothetical protein